MLPQLVNIQYVGVVTALPEKKEGVALWGLCEMSQLCHRGHLPAGTKERHYSGRNGLLKRSGATHEIGAADQPAYADALWPDDERAPSH